MGILFVALFLLVCLFVYIYYRRRDTYGFFITLGEFGAGKTQNTTAYLQKTDPLGQINITNYYTGYTDFQVSSHTDIIASLWDIYDYHRYFNLLPDVSKLHRFKKDHLPEYLLWLHNFTARYFPWKKYDSCILEFLSLWDPETLYTLLPELLKVLQKLGYFSELRKSLKFNIVLDEGSIYFNPRNFAKNFAGKNEALLDFIYQPRKLNLLMFVVVQSPMELDVKFRRLATYYRKYYKGLWFWRWYKDFYFLDPEQIDLEKAEQIWWGPIMGAFLNIRFKWKGKEIWFPQYDYNTKELIRPGSDIYKPGSIIDHVIQISKWKNPNLQ